MLHVHVCQQVPGNCVAPPPLPPLSSLPLLLRTRKAPFPFPATTITQWHTQPGGDRNPTTKGFVALSSLRLLPLILLLSCCERRAGSPAGLALTLHCTLHYTSLQNPPPHTHTITKAPPLLPCEPLLANYTIYEKASTSFNITSWLRDKGHLPSRSLPRCPQHARAGPGGSPPRSQEPNPGFPRQVHTWRTQPPPTASPGSRKLGWRVRVGNGRQGLEWDGASPGTPRKHLPCDDSAINWFKPHMIVELVCSQEPGMSTRSAMPM